MKATYIIFKSVPWEGKTKRWEVLNSTSKDIIGRICYDPSWRRYIFMPCFPTKFDTVCLTDIIDFINMIPKE